MGQKITKTEKGPTNKNLLDTMLFLPLFSPVFVFVFEFVYYLNKQIKPSGGDVVLPSLLPVFVVLLLRRCEGLQNAGCRFNYIFLYYILCAGVIIS